MRNLIITLLAATSLLAQTATSPITVRSANMLVWENPNDAALCAWANAYAVPAAGGTTRKVIATTLTNVPVATLFGGATPGIYRFYCSFTDRDGIEGYFSTNLYIYFWDGQRLKPGKGLGVK